MRNKQRTSRHSIVHVIKRLVLMLLIAIAGLLATMFAFYRPLAPKTVMADENAFTTVTPTLSVRCGRCITWPTSDIRLDIADGRQADIEPLRADGLKDIPIVRQFGVADNGILTKTQAGYQLGYNWSYGPEDCSGYHNTYLTMTQAKFITSYNPTFFDSTVIDSVTQYRRFLPFFQAYNPNTLVGYYYSGLTCIEDTTSPYTENYYPLNTIDCHRLVHSIAPNTPLSLTMKAQPWGKEYCTAQPTRWYVNVSKSEIITRFRDNLLLTVSAIKPTPPFVFLDNIEYIAPEFAWAKADPHKQMVDCRKKATAGDTKCANYHQGLAQQFGPSLYFDDFIEHYRTVIASLEQEGIRSVLNVGMAAAVIGYARDEYEFAEQFERVIGKNGINFEAPFAIAPRTSAEDTANEIKLHQRLLQDGKLVIFGEYTNETQSTWLAAMAILIREPGQSLFVMRDYSQTNWLDWPIQYGLPVTRATPLRQVASGDPNQIGHHWVMRRSFNNGEITVGHFGVHLQHANTFTVTLLASELNTETYELLYAPQLGDWNEATKIYTATHRTDPNGPVQADYFILGAECNGTPQLCKKLIAVSVGVFK